MIEIVLALLLAALPPGEDLDRAHEAVIHSFEVDDETITIGVTHCGCTRDDHFLFLVEPAREGVKEVTVIRLVPDNCDAGPLAPWLFEYSRKELKLQGAKKITLTNEFTPFTGSQEDCTGPLD